MPSSIKQMTSPLSRRRSSFKPGWGQPVRGVGGGWGTATGFGNLVQLQAPYQKSNLDFHLCREPGLNWDFQIRSFTSTPPPGHNFQTSRLCGLGQVKPQLSGPQFLTSGKQGSGLAFLQGLMVPDMDQPGLPPGKAFLCPDDLK